MAIDKKITDLDALTAANINLSNDSLVIVNANESKKITPNNLMSGRVQSDDVTKLVKLTQSQYEALVAASNTDANTLYIITIQ
jgi:hypothetical protein